MSIRTDGDLTSLELTLTLIRFDARAWQGEGGTRPQAHEQHLRHHLWVRLPDCMLQQSRAKM